MACAKIALPSEQLSVSSCAACGFAQSRTEKMILLIPSPALCVGGSVRVQVGTWPGCPHCWAVFPKKKSKQVDALSFHPARLPNLLRPLPCPPPTEIVCPGLQRCSQGPGRVNRGCTTPWGSTGNKTQIMAFLRGAGGAGGH